MRWSCVLVALLGCASAGKDTVGGRPDGGNHGDGNQQIFLDAPPPMIDAPPGMVTSTLQQTTTTTLSAGNSVGCFAAGVGSAANNWYRVFRLSDYGITTPFHVASVDFMVDYADSPNGTQPATVKLGSYGGTVDAATLGTITPITAATVSIPNGDATAAIPPPVTAPMTATIPAATNLVVELDVPDGQAAGNFFFIGVTASAENHPSYVHWPACGTAVPSSFSSVGFPGNNIVITVTGTH
jgi:hypothetical protein